MWRVILGWLFLPVFVVVFFTLLLVFHVAQVVALRGGGYEIHKKTVDWLLFCLLKALWLVGGRVRFKAQLAQLPTDRPLIVVSNHQSMYDIPLLGWLFRRWHPKYVSKKELATGIPSISYNLRHGGSVCIDRKDNRQALPALKAFGEYLAQHGYAGCIFPEGTRARDGQVKPFKPQGFAILLKTMPTAVVVPVAIQGSWLLQKYGFKPIPFGVKLTCTQLPPIAREGKTSEQIIQETEAAIRAFLGQTLEPTV
ncbi:MAG: 1-acyl-sn-glycerol-3-phosphate acyltransferase [Bernardetiaceae bacterium]|jgi:1-acyl-sn-glycerol-3-phosphate acyltransferase|nr:1-acyl-sn-glycerol-3-phosphate acyltransferase [Bernardetiaceae bacterium]